MLYLPLGGENDRFGFLPGEIEYESGKITRVTVLSETGLSAGERDTFILPGLVDIHLHGCMGVDFCNCTPKDLSVLKKMCAYEASCGVTSICPTTMTYDEERLADIMRAAGDYTRSDAESPGQAASRVIGVHLEGPFISYEKRGAQNPDYIMKPDPAMIRRLQEASGGLVRLVAIAPETEGAIDCIREFRERNGCHDPAIRFSIAHTTANYETASAAIRAGAKHVTHLYNAMPPFLNRAPGVIGAACDDADTYVELIGDGQHVQSPVIRATFKMFGPKRIVLISDSMEATGMPDGDYALGGQKVIKQGNRAVLGDGTLAGSVTNLFACMKSVISMGIPMEDAIRCATINPARSIGAEPLVGSLEVGKYADLLVCDRELNLKQVIRN
ncbi:MAG: N-acetylglucosamine-6-phosphate deacetylase [Lachnospiraceae bacterium]|nr:N-acetylglucosamine-6-phosphate deacetylase [Lachnospiraceae bacterium]